MINNQLPNSPAQAGSRLVMNDWRDNNQVSTGYQRPGIKRPGFGLLVIGSWLLVGYCILVIGVPFGHAQDNDKTAALTKQIVEARAKDKLYTPFEELKEMYFKEHRYSDLVEILKSLIPKNREASPLANYYIALSRYQQLKYLEESQGWDEYFAKGNTYRDELTSHAQKATAETDAKDSLHLYCRLLVWKFHKDQQDVFSDNALSDLMKAALEYGGYAKDAAGLGALKKVADELLAYGEKGKSRELYKVYVKELVGAKAVTEDLANTALSFYNEGNLELAQTLYDIYINKIRDSKNKEEIIPFLITLARNFAYKDNEPNDPVYAEKVFKLIEELGTKDSFNQELIYLRGFNLEKIKDYQSAKDIYLDLVQRYPASPHIDEVNFKLGIIYTYILRDIQKGKEYFEKLAHSTSSLDSARGDPERVKRVEGPLSANPEPVEGLAQESVSPQVISSLYQLGLIAQWQEDFIQAKEYYNQLAQRLGSGFSQTKMLADERLKELDEQKPIEYNLKMFLDASLGAEYPPFNPTKVEIKSSRYKLQKEEALNITSSVYTGESGCMQVELSYLWSGDLGEAKPTNDQSEFSTKYTSGGTKIINLIAVSPTGIIDRTLDFLDIN